MRKYYWKVATENIIHEIGFVSSSFEKAEEMAILYCKNGESVPLEYLGWEEVEDYERQ